MGFTESIRQPSFLACHPRRARQGEDREGDHGQGAFTQDRDPKTEKEEARLGGVSHKSIDAVNHEARTGLEGAREIRSEVPKSDGAKSDSSNRERRTDPCER